MYIVTLIWHLKPFNI